MWHSEKGTGWVPSPPRPLLAVPNVTAHPSTASVPTTVLLCNGPLLSGFNVDITGLIRLGSHRDVTLCSAVSACYTAATGMKARLFNVNVTLRVNSVNGEAISLPEMPS